ncbi:endonuclease domain-containing protein [Noviherbaspirillum agri]
MSESRRIKPERTTNARSLRSDMTLAERKLWQALRGKQIEGFRFRRQHPIGLYIADFACLDKLLLIELDGGQHQEQKEYDERRTEFLQSQGWRVLRFWNNDVLGNFEGVLASVVDALTFTPLSQPSPYEGEGAVQRMKYFSEQC